MTEQLIVGLLIGALLAVPIDYLLFLQYKKILLMCAKVGGTEKIGNEFYYIVPENRVYWIEVIEEKTRASLELENDPR